MRFSARRGLKEGVTGNSGWRHLLRNPDPKATYYAVIIGCGGHGLASGFYLAKDHRLTRIALLEVGCPRGGNLTGAALALRSRGAIMDMSPDGSPIVDTAQIDGHFLKTGWCSGRLKAVPRAGFDMVPWMATGRPSASGEKSRLNRFETGFGLMDEKGTGAQHNLQ